MASTKILCFISVLFLPLCHSLLIATPPVIIADFLNSHNKVRANHLLPPLKWSDYLANYAMWYGKQRRNDCRLIHSTLKFGENMFWGKGNQWKPSDAVAAWAVQEKYYDYRRIKCLAGKECSHYTQVVWRSSARVGCAVVSCQNRDTLIICEYDPHGNVIGQRPF